MPSISRVASTAESATLLFGKLLDQQGRRRAHFVAREGPARRDVAAERMVIDDLDGCLRVHPADRLNGLGVDQDTLSMRRFGRSSCRTNGKTSAYSARNASRLRFICRGRTGVACGYSRAAASMLASASKSVCSWVRMTVTVELGMASTRPLAGVRQTPGARPGVRVVRNPADSTRRMDPIDQRRRWAHWLQTVVWLKTASRSGSIGLPQRSHRP